MWMFHVASFLCPKCFSDVMLMWPNFILNLWDQQYPLGSNLVVVGFFCLLNSMVWIMASLLAIIVCFDCNYLIRLEVLSKSIVRLSLSVVAVLANIQLKILDKRIRFCPFHCIRKVHTSHAMIFETFFWWNFVVQYIFHWCHAARSAEILSFHYFQSSSSSIFFAIAFVDLLSRVGTRISSSYTLAKSGQKSHSNVQQSFYLHTVWSRCRVSNAPAVQIAATGRTHTQSTVSTKHYTKN